MNTSILPKDLPTPINDGKCNHLLHKKIPEISLPKANLFLSFDVLEHSMEPLSFINAISEHLEPGGVAILQTAIDRYAVTPPFGEQFEKIFDDVEHTYIYTDKAIRRLIGNTDLRIISLDHRTSLAGELIVIGKP